MKSSSTEHLRIQGGCIGIVGGVGPYAGLNLAQKIFDHTVAASDHEHLPVVLISDSQRIEDRTRFLLGQSSINPGYALAQVLIKLSNLGAVVAGIPCNTAHAPPILTVIEAELKHTRTNMILLNMIQEVREFLLREFPEVTRVGVLSTLGTIRTRIYPEYLEKSGLTVVLPDEETQLKVHEAIYDTGYGVKAQANPVTKRARETFLQAIFQLERQHVQVVILGCTEIPLAIPEKKVGHCVLIDPTTILARAMIKAFAPEKLKPY